MNSLFCKRRAYGADVYFPEKRKNTFSKSATHAVLKRIIFEYLIKGKSLGWKEKKYTG
jgi:hypothetical protein